MKRSVSILSILLLLCIILGSLVACDNGEGTKNPGELEQPKQSSIILLNTGAQMRIFLTVMYIVVPISSDLILNLCIVKTMLHC